MMKKLKCKVMILMAFVMATIAPIAPVALLVGCSGGCASVDEGADPVVVNAERVAAGSFEILDAFLKMEENNRETLRQLSPEIEKAANQIRVDGKAALEALRTSTKAYKANRTPENKANVDTWIATVESFRELAKKYLVAKKG